MERIYRNSNYTEWKEAAESFNLKTLKKINKKNGEIQVSLNDFEDIIRKYDFEIKQSYVSIMDGPVYQLVHKSDNKKLTVYGLSVNTSLLQAVMKESDNVFDFNDVFKMVKQQENGYNHDLAELACIFSNVDFVRK